MENQRVVPTEKAQKVYENYELNFFMESSAKTGMNVQEIFIEAAKVLYKEYLEYNLNKKKNKDKDKDLTKKLSDKPIQKDANKKGCC